MPAYSFDTYLAKDRQGRDHALGTLWKLAEESSELIDTLKTLQEGGAIPQDSAWLAGFEGFHAALSDYIHDYNPG